MSDTESHHHGKNEIIIIKRHGGDHDGAHGGAWKIAYADFMTAMMAFFLVMWLVNAANEETKAAVASYFNPIKLTDSKPSQRGLKKPAKDANGQATQDKSKNQDEEAAPGSASDTGQDHSTTVGQEVKYSEADYFENPYAVLAEIAKDTDIQANVSVKGQGGASDSGPATGAEGGPAYRDPFDPDFWTKQIEVTTAPTVTADPSLELPNGGEQNPEGIERFDDKDAPLVATDKADPGDKRDAGLKHDEGKTPKPKPLDEVLAERLEKKLRDELGLVVGKLAQGLSVKASEGGLLISISDQVKSPMFNVGSSVPKRETVLAMKTIASVLADSPGQIIIRGHTDGRQYQKGEFDNWRLSTARAQSAYFMLLEGGLAEGRVGQVSGFADRQLKIPKDPMNDQNRRIEILIKADQG